MNKEELKEYINILADMENHIFLQKTLIQNLETYSKSLGRPEKVDMPDKPVQKADKTGGICRSNFGDTFGSCRRFDLSLGS